MGQTQSTTHKRERGEASDSFDFDSKITGVDFATFTASTGKQEIRIDKDTVLKRVTDDGGEGYVPVSETTSQVKQTVPVVFRWEYGGKEVYISGNFSDWKTKVPMTFSGGEHNAIIELPSGIHQFKYHVDGNWVHDPSQKTIDDTFGGRNNVIDVNESDFDATEALLKDECGTESPPHVASSASLSRKSPPGSYSQLVPSPGDMLISNADNPTVPPSLPPQLLNVILNNDVVDSEDPTLLPVPNHVALNHLYALSIKDSVMTLSGTHRYKRKYVTTIMYKPINLS